MRYPSGGIAFFDSGIGGLTTLATCVEYAKIHFLGDFNYFYYGDNFNAPYGNLPENQIFEYVDRAFAFFQELRVRAVVIACNTVTAVCADRLRKKYPFPIIGLEPAILPSVKQGGETFVLATRATCNSDKFKNLCEKAKTSYPNSKLSVFACDGLAGEIEKGLGKSDKSYLDFLPNGKPDGVVLGCTHYIYIRKQIELFYECKTYDGNEGVARQLFNQLFQIEKEDLEYEKIVFKNHFQLSIFQKNDFFLKTQPLVTTGKNMNKSSKIYFVGDAQVVNKTKYEQMFV